MAHLVLMNDNDVSRLFSCRYLPQRRNVTQNRCSAGAFKSIFFQGTLLGSAYGSRFQHAPSFFPSFLSSLAIASFLFLHWAQASAKLGQTPVGKERVSIG